jgi:hypothetical protein
MGMFDRIIFKCPKCNYEIEEQSKAGDCLLRDYSQDAVPLAVAGNIIDGEVYCENCKEHFVIAADNIPPPATIQMRLTKK